MSKSQYWSALVLCMVSALGLSGCGEEDVTAEVVDASLEYSGETTQAHVDADNKEDLALTAIAAFRSADLLRAVPLEAPAVAAQLSAIYLHGADHGGTTGPAVPAGDCSGSATVSNVDADQLVVYADYCVTATGGAVYTLNGEVTHGVGAVGGGSHGIGDTNGWESVSFDYLTVGNDSAVTAFSGGLMVDDVSGDVWYGVKFNSDGVVRFMEGTPLSGTVTQGTRIDQLTVSDPDHGYFVVSSTSNIFTNSCESGVPHSGKLLMQGANDSSASVQFLNCEQYQVCSNGDSLCRVMLW